MISQTKVEQHKNLLNTYKEIDIRLFPMTLVSIKFTTNH